MKTLLKAAAIVALGMTGAACASTSASDEPELVVDGQEWECRRAKEIGTRLGKKTCASPETWAERDAEEAEMAAETSRRIREQGSARSSEGGFGQ
jgi:hypothetical protein